MTLSILRLDEDIINNSQIISTESDDKIVNNDNVKLTKEYNNNHCITEEKEVSNEVLNVNELSINNEFSKIRYHIE